MRPDRTAGTSRVEPVADQRSAACGPPGVQLLGGPLLAEGPVVHAQLEQVPVGLAHLAAGTDAEDGHDLVAVEVGAQGVELLLLGQPLDPDLEVVVGAPQALGRVRAGAACFLWTRASSVGRTRKFIFWRQAERNKIIIKKKKKGRSDASENTQIYFLFVQSNSK